LRTSEGSRSKDVVRALAGCASGGDQGDDVVVGGNALAADTGLPLTTSYF